MTTRLINSLNSESQTQINDDIFGLIDGLKQDDIISHDFEILNTLNDLRTVTRITNTNLNIRQKTKNIFDELYKLILFRIDTEQNNENIRTYFIELLDQINLLKSKFNSLPDELNIRIPNIESNITYLLTHRVDEDLTQRVTDLENSTLELSKVDDANLQYFNDYIIKIESEIDSQIQLQNQSITGLIDSLELKLQEQINTIDNNLDSILNLIISKDQTLLYGDGTSFGIRNIYIKTSNYSAIDGDCIFINNTNSITITLPPYPELCEIVVIADYNADFYNNNVTIESNKKINGSFSNITLNQSCYTKYIYSGELYGWITTSADINNIIDWKYINSDYSPINSENLFIDTTDGSVTLTLPSLPKLYDKITISNISNNYDVNSLIINGNGNKINNQLIYTINTNHYNKTLIYTGSTYGWVFLVSDILTTIGSITTNTTLTTNSYNFIDTSTNSLTVTLPSAPNVGDTVTLIDAASSFSNHNLTVNPNGLKILNSTSNYTVDISNAKVSLVYSGITYGWVLTNNTNGTNIDFIYKDTNFTASINKHYLLGPTLTTITLPSVPDNNSYITFIDTASRFKTKPVTITAPSMAGVVNIIANSTQTFTLDISNQPITLIYNNIKGWLLADDTNTSTWKVINYDYQSVAGDHLYVDTNLKSLNINLPQSPTLGDAISIIDYSSTFTSNKVVIKSTTKILGTLNPFEIDVNNTPITLTYSGSVYGWVLTNDRKNTGWNSPSSNFKVINTATYTTSANELLLVDTSIIPITIIIPSLSVNQYVNIVDVKGTFATHNCLIHNTDPIIHLTGSAPTSNVNTLILNQNFYTGTFFGLNNLILEVN